mmetsp:Transcript_73996/g.228688  ORF Transcript_73996/g.228688 Transcript_73996/m.228688 type:complete len:232 (+) Transcript_73996:352-1047(+)
MPFEQPFGSLIQKLHIFIGMKLLLAKRLGSMPAATNCCGPPCTGPAPAAAALGTQVPPFPPLWVSSPPIGNAIQGGMPAACCEPQLGVLPGIRHPVGAGVLLLTAICAGLPSPLPSVKISTGSPNCRPSSARPWPMGQASPCSQQTGWCIQKGQSCLGVASGMNSLGPSTLEEMASADCAACAASASWWPCRRAAAAASPVSSGASISCSNSVAIALTGAACGCSSSTECA